MINREINRNRGLICCILVLSAALIMSWFFFLMKYPILGDVMLAIETNNHGKIRDLNRRYNLAEKPVQGEYAIIYAIRLQRVGVVYDMIRDKYNLNVMDRMGSTPLNIAVVSCSPGMVETLIKSGADPNRDMWISPMYLSIVEAKNTKDKIEIMLKNKAVFMNTKEKEEATKLLGEIDLKEYIDQVKATPVKQQ